MPWFLLLAIVLLALAWGYVFFRHCGLLGGCVAAMATGCCFGHPFFHISAVTIDRVLLVLLLGGFFAQRCFFGLPAKRFSRGDVGLLLFLGILSLSTLTHDWRIAGAQPVATLLFFYLMPWVLYWVASRCTVRERDFRWVLAAFSAFGLYLAVTAVLEVSGFLAAVFPRYIASVEHAEFFGRGRGPLLNPVGNGYYMTACLLATLLLWPYVRKAHRLLVAAAAAVLLVGMVCTMTRSVWLGGATAVVGMAILCTPRQHRLRTILAAALLGGAALTATGNHLWQFKRDRHVSAAEMAESAKLRPILAAYAFEVFREHPWQGVGFGQYVHRNVDYLTERSFDVPMEKAKAYVQHNVFLALLSETGLLGLSAFLVVLGIWAGEAWQTWHARQLPLWRRQIGLWCLLLLVAYVANGMFHDLSLIPMLNALVFFVAGLLRGQQEQLRAVATTRAAGRSGISPMQTSGWSLG